MSEIQKFLDVLELNADANWEQVTQAYRDLIKIWHPDRFTHDEKLRERAEQKSKELNEAVRQLRRHYRRTRHYKRSEVNEAVAQARSGVFQSARSKSSQTAFRSNGANVEQRYDPSRSHPSYQALARKQQRLSRLRRLAAASVLTLSLALVLFMGIPSRFKGTEIFQVNPMLTPMSPPTHYRVIGASSDSATPKKSETGSLRSPSSGAPEARPPIIDAAANCKVDLIEDLLRKGGNVNAIDANGDTALAWAARRNCASAAKLLLESGINSHTVARNGFTPKDWAVWAKSNHVLELLPKQN